MKQIKILSLIFATALLFTSCSKDQVHLKWLGQGTWTLISFTKNGKEFDFGGTMIEQIQYEECKVKDGDCNGSEFWVLELDDGTGTVTGESTFTYSVHDKGTQLTLTVLTSTFDGATTNCDTDCVATFDIIEMTKDQHVISRTDENGNVWVKTLKYN